VVGGKIKQKSSLTAEAGDPRSYRYKTIPCKRVTRWAQLHASMGGPPGNWRRSTIWKSRRLSIPGKLSNDPCRKEHPMLPKLPPCLLNAWRRPGRITGIDAIQQGKQKEVTPKGKRTKTGNMGNFPKISSYFLRVF
jgi:hypothetical protein